MKIARNIQLTSDQINEIAEELECGNRCFYHYASRKVKGLIDRDLPYYDPLDETEEEWAEIDENVDEYVELQKMNSSESFAVMEAFIDRVSDQRLASRLSRALARPKPFRSFKAEIDESDYREKWFQFKKAKMVEWVEEQVHNHNSYASPETD